jgi:LPS export ABC transporter protein LptC
MKNKVPALLLLIIFLITACTFDYDESPETERETPDLIMRNVIYMRVRSSDPIARFEAELAERFEERGFMRLQNFSFEQFGDRGNEVNSFGRAGNARIDIETGDVFMDNGVRLEIESEDIILETNELDWKDEAKILSSGSDDEVRIIQESGTQFTGIGLLANARTRTWEFLSRASGMFVSDEEDDDERVIVVVEIPEDRPDDDNYEVIYEVIEVDIDDEFK